MKIYLLKHNHSGRNLIWYWYSIVQICFFAFISCSHQTSIHPKNDTVNRQPTSNKISKPLFTAPTVILITFRNHPTTVKAGKPIIKIVSSGEAFTAREKEVLQLLTKGHSIKAIAADLVISFDTACTHLKNIYNKLHVNCGKEAIAKVLRERII